MPPAVQTKFIRVELVQANEKCMALFLQVGWWELLQLFMGHIDELVKYCFSYFNGRRAYVIELEIKVNLRLVVTTTHLHLEHEC